ncbi:ABC transporter G family member 48 [Linum perenne]
MAAALTGGVLVGSTSSRRSFGSTSQRSWLSTAADVFSGGGAREKEDEEDELRWAAIERLPTFDRMRKGVLNSVIDGGSVVDVTKLGAQERKKLMESILNVVEDDNENFLRRLRDRTDRVGIKIPKIEVRYEHLSIEGEVHVGSRALPSLLNAAINTIENVLGLIRLAPSRKRKIQILQDISGIVKPARMTLLLGPPGAGKTTMLLALAGKLDSDLKESGKVTYCGHEFSEFIPQRTCAYISQHDLHHGEFTVRETFNFSGQCLGVGTRYEILTELSRREKAAGILPDPEIDAFMKATAVSGQKTSLVTDYILKILGLDICADIIVGDEMQRGISGGQKKRVTTGMCSPLPCDSRFILCFALGLVLCVCLNAGEMLVGPAKVLLMDEISTGLDSSTTFQICKFMRQMVHILEVTMIISLLQPAPETFELFDDIILLAGGRIVYQGPRENVLEFFESAGFKCPERKGVADFLQEVTSKKDQEQYWHNRNQQPYRFVSATDFAQRFESSHIGQQIGADLRVPYDRSKVHPAALVKTKYGISNWDLFKACFSREWLLMTRHSFLYIFKTSQITIMSIIAFTVFLRTKMKVGTVRDGDKFLGALFFSLINVMFNGMAELAMTVFRLPVFYKQRDFLFYPAWAFAVPIWVLRIPVSLVESAIWIALTYYTIGFAPAASRLFKQFLAFVGIHQMGLSLFRFIAAVGRTQVVSNTLGVFVLLITLVMGGFIISKDDIQPWMIWGYYTSPLMYGQNAIAINEFLDDRWSAPNPDPRINATTVGEVILKSRGFYTEEHWFWICIAALFGFSVLFNVWFIAALAYLSPYGDSKAVIQDDDMEKKTKMEGSKTISFSFSANDHSGTKATRRGMVLPFRPLSLAFNHVNYYVDMPSEMKTQGVTETRLQLLRDVSGAFRPGILTALVGVSGAGKTTLMDVLAGRKTGGYIEGSINISGYPKHQSTFARVSGYCEQTDIHSPNVTVHESLVYSAWLRLPRDINPRTRKEVMELVELNPIRDALVGLPGVDGLSTEQRKRLTIAVELVANPSIIFMDEPTSGLDARAAAIVMRAVRNTVDTGRTVVCTIHQPSIDIFEAFDELLLMKRGGQVIYAGPLGRCSRKLVEYFEAVPGVPKINKEHNPATWMLEVTSPAMETQLEIDFTRIYEKSSLYQEKQQDLSNLLGGMYAAVFFLGATNTSTVQPIVAVERTVFYRERAAGMYSALPYAFGQVTVEAIYIAVQTLLYHLILYTMIGFEWKAGKFFLFFYFIYMAFVYFTLYGMMMVALTPNHQIAAVCMSFFLSFWNLFSGFLIPRPQIPIWWRWYYWCSPVAWTLYGVVTSQIGDKENLMEIPGLPSLAVNKVLEIGLGFEHSFLPVVVVAHLGFVCIFFFVFAFGIKFINFQTR